MDWCHPAVNVINQASTKTTFSCKPVCLRYLLIRTLASTTCGLYNFIHKIFAKFMSFCRVVFLLLDFRISLFLLMLLLLLLCISLKFTTAIDWTMRFACLNVSG
jgi:hypothetical protein